MSFQNITNCEEFFCSTCGEQISYDVKKCPNCGAELLISDAKDIEELKQGHSLTKKILSSSFGLILVLSLLDFLITKNQSSSKVLIVIVLILLLYILFYRGHNFARYITVAMLGCIGVFGIIKGSLMITRSFLALIPIALGILYVFFSLVLLTSRSVRIFQTYQKNNRIKDKENTTFWMLII